MMKRSDERQRLEEEYAALKKDGLIQGGAVDFTDSLLALLDKTETRLAELEDRISKLEDFSDIISMDLFDIQSAILKKIDPDALNGRDAQDIFAGFGDDDDEEDEDDDCDDEDCHCGHSHHSCGHEDCDCGDCADDDEEENRFVRCPYCNTLIFIKGDEEKLVCPFCGEKFLLSDVL